MPVTNMDKVIIRRPRKDEIDRIHAFFILVLQDTFAINGISELKELLAGEIQDKKRCIQQDFETDGSERFFLLAEYRDEIIGSIEYGTANDLLNTCTSHELEGMPEIGTVFVHPRYQRQGVAPLLLYSLFQELNKNDVEEICFDSGYKIAQKIWCKKFGEPEYFLENYWGEGSHHMVWRLNVRESLELLLPAKEKCKL